MTLAYVFWHWPAQPGGYEAAIERFHAALARPGTATFRLERAPWDSSRPAPYEDWYPVEDWAAVGELNDFAITGSRRAPHDAVAGLSHAGAGGIYRLIREGPALPDVRFAAWLHRPPAAPPEGAAVWQRQLVLGPAPEYAVLAASPVPLEDGAGAVLTGPRLVAARS
ncbi:MAG TPA: hypothetical protein VGW75_17680 [Solirubrobacteraceae bacterium]|nr:hypothetical protein [Solirubrobacteraceae bacterium]